MPEYLAPGVYVEEIEIGAKPIEGVSTSTAGFLGETERGPIEPRLVTGMEQFRRLYGATTWSANGAMSPSTLPYAVEGFFTNGGKRCFIARVVGARAATAQWPPKAEEQEQAEAAIANAQAKKTAAEETAATAKEKADETKAAEEAKAAAEAERPRDDAKVTDATKKAEAAARESERAAQAADTARKDADKAATDAKSAATKAERKGVGPLTIKAIGPGAWGNRISVEVGDAALSDQVPSRFRLSIFYDNAQGLRGLQEDYDDLSSLPDSPQYFERRINNISTLITVAPNPLAGHERPANAAATALQGGRDGEALQLADYKGRSDEPGQRTALNAFREIDEISIVCAPDEDGVAGLKTELVAHCENMQDRFAILQPPSQVVPIVELAPTNAQGNRIDSKYAAIYAPQIKVIDGATGMARDVPPGGHIAGIYARSDIERGVHKAPANEVIRGAVGVQVKYTADEQAILNPRGVNCIRVFPARGIRVWGARTISSDPLWKYVNVRRLFLYLEESIEQGTQWVVFEPNDQRLWARVRQSVADFLTTVWRSGALMGNSADQAFFVKCDETTMTQNDIDNGRLIVVIGVAPVKPAEFVIFRIAQWTQGSEGAA